MGYDYSKRKCPRMQKVMLLLLVVAVVSMIATLHTSDSLTWLRARSDVKTNQFNGAGRNNDEMKHLTLEKTINNVKANHMTQSERRKESTEFSFKPGFSKNRVLDTQDRKVSLLADFKRRGFREIVSNATIDSEMWFQDIVPRRTETSEGHGYDSKAGSKVLEYGSKVKSEMRDYISKTNNEIHDYGSKADSKIHDFVGKSESKFHDFVNRTGSTVYDLGNIGTFFHQKLKSHVDGKDRDKNTTVKKSGFKGGNVILQKVFNSHTKQPTASIKEAEYSTDNSSLHGTASTQFTTLDNNTAYMLEKAQFRGVFNTDTNLSTLTALFDKISQIEDTSQLVPGVAVKGSLSAVKHHLPLIEAAFHKFKAKVTYEAGDDKETYVTEGNSRCVVMCLNYTYKEDNCVISPELSTQHKANVIPELMSVIMSPSLLCDKREETLQVSETGQWYRGKLPCYSQGFEHVIKEDSCNITSGWWIVRRNNSGSSRQYIPCGSGLIPLRHLNQSSGEIIVIPLPHNLLSIEGAGPLVWQFEVLMTSLLPPRVYLHPAGIAWSGLQDFVHRKHQKNVSLLDLRQLILELDSDNSASLILERVESVIMDVVRLVEKHIATARDNKRFCQTCFQLLDVVLVFESTFEPLVLEVTPSHFSEHLSSLSDYLLEQNVLEDLAAMLMSREIVSTEVLRAMIDLGITHIRDEKVCEEKESFCLGEYDISYLLDTRREQRASRNWIRLFPSSASSCKHIHSSNPKTVETRYGLSQKPVGPLEKFALLLEESFLCPLRIKGKMKALMAVRNAAACKELAECGGICDGRLANISESLIKTCDNDNSSLLHLSAIHTYPYIQLFPEFSPLNTEYHAYTDYHTTLVQIQGVPKHCGTQVRLEDKQISSRWGNVSLGFGQNTVHILVVGMNNPEPFILNTYKLIIYRKRSGSTLGRMDPHTGHYQACSLKQDCSLPLSSSTSCGLQHVSHLQSWREFISHYMTLPACTGGIVAGEWMVPCFDCKSEPSCLWSEAVWQTPGCHEVKLGSNELKDCFAGKKVLFIGDSTNRGILHYILERLNGSLQEWDKTHYIRIYTDLNNGRTVFGFAYYPQFWLMPGERPMFEKALFQLLNRTAEWSDKEVVIVLGGVHWLARHHLDVLVEGLRSGSASYQAISVRIGDVQPTTTLIYFAVIALETDCMQHVREGISNSNVIVKGLGAGFHQPISGVHQLSLEQQIRFSNQNYAVLSYAQSLGFSTLDTFSMTMARYKDFLQGKCACHFHQVSEVKPSIARKLTRNVSSLPENEVLYHVEGDINAAYSEMVINRICALNGG